VRRNENSLNEILLVCELLEKYIHNDEKIHLKSLVKKGNLFSLVKNSDWVGFELWKSNIIKNPSFYISEFNVKLVESSNKY
jgi:hypothetical protein